MVERRLSGVHDELGAEKALTAWRARRHSYTRIPLTLSSVLVSAIEEIAQRASLRVVAVAFHDFERDEKFSHHGTQPFHAASTFKTAILLALLRETMLGRVRLEDQLQVRNRFLSVIDGTPYRIEGSRDGDDKVHRQIGRSLSLEELAHAMITRSSNLATNLLLDFITVERVQETLRAAGIVGVLIRRGVEDMTAHEHGVNNEASAEGLVALFRAIYAGGLLSEKLRHVALEILLAQEFRGMIPARLPDDVKVAHKTGEISTNAHDSALVFPPGRQPYAVAILTETEPHAEGRANAVARISEAVYTHLTTSQS
jgi:beta-lactamase class A